MSAQAAAITVKTAAEIERTYGALACRALPALLEWLALRSDLDALAGESHAITMMTVHSAKGLEFPAVFVAGLEEGIFPHVANFAAADDPAKLEEERRLAFVAMTRAKKGLFLTEAGGRNLDGSPRYPSRFILDIDQNLLTYVQPPADSLIEDARQYIRLSSRWLSEENASPAFPRGQRVRHFLFGEGTVVEVDLAKKAHIVQFDRMDTPRSISFKAKLEALEPEL